MTLDALTNKEAVCYVKTWIIAMRVILNWPEERTLQWSERRLPSLNDPDSLFYNGTPSQYIILQIIPDRLYKRLPGGERVHLHKLILDAIQQGDSFCAQKPDFDWKLARQRIEAVLNAYGESFPPNLE